MDSKQRLSAVMEDDSFGTIAALPPPSMARSQSPAPSGRFSLRRSVYSTRSSTSDASSASSGSSAGSPPSCVARETSKYECSRHRFIVWAAVNRNSCERMTDVEKRECPLLRCTKRFPDHESMLRHLVECEYLSFAEYWCFTHSRVERFDDSKCKRCIGPGGSKRRKMMSMAKTFFSSLGHKQKKGSGLDLGLGDSVTLLSPLYDEDNPRDLHFELSSTEIVELDSTEVVLPLVSHASVNPQDLLLPELDSNAAALDSFVWQPSPLLGGASLASPADHLASKGPAVPKPFLQLHTQGLEQFRQAPRPRPVAPPVLRSKNLSPSSSVRSTASTMSTMSTISSIISPISVWSHGSHTWSSGLDTSLTSPTTDGELLPNGAWDEDPSFCDYACPADLTHDISSELPADVPSQKAGALAVDPLLFPYDAALSTAAMSYDANVVLTQESDVLALGPMPIEDAPPVCYSETKAFVTAAWDLALAHIADSLDKIQNMEGNHLASELRLLTPKVIAGKGFQALRCSLDGYHPNSAIDALCLVHLVYALSIATYGNEASAQFKKFFAQTLAYARHFPHADREPYTHVAVAIWLPAGVTQAELDRQMELQYISMQAPYQCKGKEAQAGHGNTDALTCAAREYLDELEMSAILGHPASSLEVLTSNLFTKHFPPHGGATPNQPFNVTVNFILGILLQSFSDANGLPGKLRGLHQRMLSGSIQTVRRVELELLQAGKVSMSPAAFFGKFVPQVRALCDQLYAEHERSDYQRSSFHADTVSLMESLIDDGSPDATDILDAMDAMDTMDGDSSLENFLNDYPSTFNSDPRPLLPPATNEAEAAAAAVEFATATPESTPPVASGASSSEGPSDAPTDDQSAGSKVEAHDCCEICGYRPKGDPQWFRGSMAKHRKLQHSTAPPKIYKCPFPGCNSQYKNRQDNLRQHQIEKNHWVGQEAVTKKTRRPHHDEEEADGDTEAGPTGAAAAGGGGQEATRRPSKRKKVSE